MRYWVHIAESGGPKWRTFNVTVYRTTLGAKLGIRMNKGRFQFVVDADGEGAAATRALDAFLEHKTKEFQMALLKTKEWEPDEKTTDTV